MRTTNKYLLILLISIAGPVFGQDTPEVDPAPEVDPPPVRDDGEFEPDLDGEGDDTNIEGDLNTSNSNNNNVSKTFNGAGSRSMPASTAIAPSLMSNGSESCLQSISGGLQLVGIGVSSGKYMQDVECNRRRDAITLSNMGMKVAAVALMCQNPKVWRAMFMSATPCPIIRSGRLVVGKSALLTIKQQPELHIPDYEEEKIFYDKILGVGEDTGNEETDSRSISDRYRTSIRDGN
tara:strand:+ start:232 stop:936 length:705 start_codon:yes stop_codon:yes gene_type:complete